MNKKREDKSDNEQKRNMTDSYQSDHDRISHLINLTDIISDALISTDLEFNALE